MSTPIDFREITIADQTQPKLRKFVAPIRTPLGDTIYTVREFNERTKLETEHITIECSKPLDAVAFYPGTTFDRLLRR